MNDYILLTDSCVDLTQEMADQLDLHVVPLSVLVDGNSYQNYLDGRELSPQAFYSMLREHKKTSTSQVTTVAFMNAMTPILQEGKDVLLITFSSALSGTHSSAERAKKELETEYPKRKIVVIDSLCASMGQGLLCTYVSKLKREGKTIEEVSEWIQENRLNVCHLFTVGDLDHLRRGGRLSAATAFIGNLLSIKPLLHVSKEGKLVQTGKAHGRKRSLDTLVSTMITSIVHPEDQVVYISHADCYEEAVYVKEKIMKVLPIQDIHINYVGPVIGSHSGVGTLAIFFMGKDRFLRA
ncbi:MAG: DegV family protein [Bacilli bacterium]|nr:DegV family protein [Bacilli bacterium]MDD4213158.1 DegV family protein [Bacilli bacterium]